MNEMIERVAKALADNARIRLGYTDSNYAEYNWEKFSSDAIAAISAMREPTHKMAGVGDDMAFCAMGSPSNWSSCAREAWRAMIDEALK